MFARTASGDLAFPLVVVADVTTIAAQKIQNVLNLWLGEWSLDTSQGFPWLQRVLGVKNPMVTQIRALLRQAILQVPGVMSVTEVQAVVNTQKRTFAYFVVAKLNTGQVLTGGSGLPFTVSGSSS